MQVVEKPQLLTVEEYLEGEQHGEVRHEYIGGMVYAMAGGSIDHNLITLNFVSTLRSHLAGKRCRVLMADVKVRLEIAQADVFYYPDVMVGCVRGTPRNSTCATRRSLSKCCQRAPSARSAGKNFSATSRSNRSKPM